MQLRADQKHLQLRTVWSELAGHFRILESRLVAKAQEEPLGAVDAEAIDEFTAKISHRRYLHQQHALLAKPDLAFRALKTNPPLRS